MMNMSFIIKILTKNWFLLLVILILSANAGAQDISNIDSDMQDEGVVLNGFAENGKTSLIWMVNGWPKDIVGFSVKKSIGESNTWSNLGDSPIYPEISMTRDWAALGLDEEQAVTYKEKLRKYLDEGVFPEVSKSEFISQLNEFGMRSGDRILLKKSYDIALILGFGFIDFSSDLQTSPKYGLFGVFEDGSETQFPLDTYSVVSSADRAKLAGVDLVAEQKGMDIELGWNVDKQVSETLGIIGYNIYRRRTDNNEWEQIGPSRIGWRELEDNMFVWGYVDKESDAFQKWSFAVAPVNTLGIELEKSIASYEPAVFEPAKIKSLEIKDNTSVLMRWEIDEQSQLLTEGFYVERALVGTTNFIRLNDELFLPRVRSTRDNAPPPFSELQYRVVTVDTQGIEHFSLSEKMWFSDPRAPEAPKDFNLTFYQTNGLYYVRGDWVPPSGENVAVKYRVYSDANYSHSLIRENISSTNSYLWTLGNEKGGRDYTFGVQPGAEGNIYGPQVLDSIYISTLKAPRLEEQNAELMDSGDILLSWEYPVLKDLIGFKIFIDEELVKTEKDVPADARSWIISDYPDHREHTYALKLKVEAVFPLCGSETKNEAIVTMNINRPDRTIPAVSMFNVSAVGTYQGVRWAYLKINNLYIDPKVSKRLKGLVVGVSQDDKGGDSFDDLHIKSCTEYYLPIPSEFESGSVYFRCAMASDNSIGLVADNVLALSRKEWGKILSEDEYESMMRINALGGDRSED